MTHVRIGIATLIAPFFFFIFSFSSSAQGTNIIDCGLVDFSVQWDTGYTSKEQCLADFVLKYWTVRSIDKAADTLLVCVDSLLVALAETDAKNLRSLHDIFDVKAYLFASKYKLLEKLQDYRKTIFLYREKYPSVDEDEEWLSNDLKKLKAITNFQQKILRAYESGILTIEDLNEIYALIYKEMSFKELEALQILFEEKRKKD